MCGGGGAPKDNSDKVAQIEAQAAEKARAEAAQREVQQRQEFDSRLGSSYNTGVESARQFFASRGLNPDDYMGAISGRANAVRSGIPALDANPGSYFSDLGQSVYDAEQAALRNKSLRGVNSIFSDDYSQKRVTNDLDDATINAILGEQQGTAENYVNNLLARGVITGSGSAAALKNIAGQKATANARLDEIGGGLLEGGRTKLNEIINGGRTRASNLELGDVFDPYSYQGQVDTSFTDFLNSLGNNLRAKAPTDLFSTSGLAGVAGAAQGAGNTVYDPQALAGIFDEEDDDGTNNSLASSPF